MKKSFLSLLIFLLLNACSNPGVNSTGSSVPTEIDGVSLFLKSAPKESYQVLGYVSIDSSEAVLSGQVMEELALKVKALGGNGAIDIRSTSGFATGLSAMPRSNRGFGYAGFEDIDNLQAGSVALKNTWHATAISF